MTPDFRASYIAKKPCGCYVAAMVIGAEDRGQFKEDARTVLRWLLDGLTVEVVSVEFVRANLQGCTHKQSAEQMEIA